MSMPAAAVVRHVPTVAMQCAHRGRGGVCLSLRLFVPRLFFVLLGNFPCSQKCRFALLRSADSGFTPKKSHVHEPSWFRYFGLIFPKAGCPSGTREERGGDENAANIPRSIRHFERQKWHFLRVSPQLIRVSVLCIAVFGGLRCVRHFPLTI